MHTIETLKRSAVAVAPDTTIKAAARVMEAAGVGALGVVDDGLLTGIVTDRDLVRRAMARGLPLDGRVDAVMSTPVVTIDVGADVHSVFALLRANAIRRVPVVRAREFVGMITVDDLLVSLAADLSDLAKPVAKETTAAHRDSPVPAAS
jgi:signal-transduction protein with cAMP-binding, CBS, and nucleotidyltransferase domain